MQDIIAELEKPGRDPRPAFAAATFSEGIEKISDLRPGMVLEGTVTNVAAFGAFVDVGVHQDGLVHVSALANRFVSDPREVVKSGQVVRVKVLEADPDRKRISLTLRLDDEPAASVARGAGGRRPAGVRTPARPPRPVGGKSRRSSRPATGARAADSRQAAAEADARTGAGQHGDGRGAAEGRTRKVGPGEPPFEASLDSSRPFIADFLPLVAEVVRLLSICTMIAGGNGPHWGPSPLRRRDTDVFDKQGSTYGLAGP